MFFKILKFLYVFLIFRVAHAALVCEKSTVEGIDFACGDVPEPFQPCKDFEVIAGRADRSTTLWVLAEIHAQKEVVYPCVEAISALSPDHTVYAEGEPSSKEFNCAKIDLTNKSGRKCVGWDDMAAHKEIMQLSSMQPMLSEHIIQIIINKFYQKYREGKLSDKQFANYLQMTKENYATFDQAKMDEHHGHSVVAAIDRLLKSYQNNPRRLSFQDIFSNPKKETSYLVMEADVQKSKSLHRKRNQSFVKTINQHPKDKLGIARIGVNHVSNRYADDSYDNDYIKQELEKGPHQNRYAVLRMRK